MLQPVLRLNHHHSGLEIDTKMIARNARTSGKRSSAPRLDRSRLTLNVAAVIIAVGGICLPFGLGVGVAVPLYHQFVESYSPSFPHFMLFVGVVSSFHLHPL